MNPVHVMLVSTLLVSGDSSSQELSSLKSFLASHAQGEPKLTSLAYKASYQGFRNGKPTGRFQQTGSLVAGVGRNGGTWVGVPKAPLELSLGEPGPQTEGEAWFRHLCEPSRMDPWTNPVALLQTLVERVPIKGAMTPGGETGAKEERVLVFPLEAPRPNAKFWTYQSKIGEVRLRIQRNGAPLSLEVVQAYEGHLSPHFGTYALNRHETWTFSMDEGQIRTKSFRLVLRRQDWRHAYHAELEMTAGGSP